MTLRMKLLLALGPLVLALVVSGVVGTMATARLGRSAELILKDNYRSVLSAQRMQEALEQLNTMAAMVALGYPGLTDVKPERPHQVFESELQVEEHNITEPGETEAAAGLRTAWTRFAAQHARILATDNPAERKHLFLDELTPAFRTTREHAHTVLVLNQDAIVRKSEAAQRTARQLHTVLVSVTLLGCLLALWASTALIRRLLRPLNALTHAAKRIGEGHLEVRAPVGGKDEIGELAAEFNTMAEHLQMYRQSSLGELLEAQQAAQATLDSLSDPVIGLGLDGKLLHVNRAAEEKLDLRAQVAMMDPLANLAPPVRAAVTTVRDHVLSGRGTYVPRSLDEAMALESKAGTRHLLPHASPVYAEDGSVQGVIVVLQDVTRLLRLDELKNNVVATVAHEFRTPLTSLRMAIHMCLEEAAGPLTEKQADLLQAGREDCERLQTIVDELLDLSRIQSGRMELKQVPVSVDTLIKDAVEAHQHRAEDGHVHVRVELLEDAGSLMADPERVHVVLSNLLTNAIRVSPPGAEVVVKVSVHPGWRRIEVVDHGPGIAPEQQAAIFEKHVQGGQSGSAGLGLYIAQEIVQAHGGRMGVESTPGQGATFWFSLPASTRAA